MRLLTNGPLSVVPYAAMDIEEAATELMRAVAKTTTRNEAMDLWKLARTLEQQVAAVTEAAWTRAIALSREEVA